MTNRSRQKGTIILFKTNIHYKYILKRVQNTVEVGE